MLIYESTGSLEVEVKDLKQLSRSKVVVPIGPEGAGAFDLHAILCEYHDNSEQRCRAAFYAKSLKRALVFTASGGEQKSSWLHSLDLLGQLGFEMESVNLRLSPAMLDVVLRDIPGFATPAEARSQRAEQTQYFAELQQAYNEDPESPEGKKAELKLNAEKRLEERAASLRELLENEFTPEANANEEVDALLLQVKDLTARLETAEKQLESERSQREFSESIAEAAEKRIQELEEVLVDVETKSSGEIKLKRKIANLQGQVKKLEDELQTTLRDLEAEREKQGQFVADVKASQVEIAILEKGLQEKQSETEQLAQDLSAAELHIKGLLREVQTAQKGAADHEELVAASRETLEKLEETQQALTEARLANQKLEQELAASDAPDKLAAVQQECDRLAEQLEGVREELEQEHSVRRRLERCALEDEKRIAELEKSLAATGDRTEDKSGSDAAVESAALTELRHRLDEELGIRQELEQDLDDAHKMIDSLEKMIRETQGSTSGWGKDDRDDNAAKVTELEDKVKFLEAQFEQEKLEQNRLSKELAAAERRLTEQEDALQKQAEAEMVMAARVAAVARDDGEAGGSSKSSKKLPHELRPAPAKGALFHPDWDLAGLPCTSGKDVLRAWETLFNVQISIEGYPAQYCMAFLAVLRQGNQKKVYLMYRLKMNKHTLVCVPAKTPKDEKSLQKLIDEGLKFLRLSGFEMEELGADLVDNALQSYFAG